MPTVASACQDASISSRIPNCVRNHLTCESSGRTLLSVVSRNLDFSRLCPSHGPLGSIVSTSDCEGLSQLRGRSELTDCYSSGSRGSAHYIDQGGPARRHLKVPEF